MKAERKNIVWLSLILALAIWFRIYNIDKGFSFAHDQDLYSWIAKDIIINGHQRLIGQVTSVDGIFIGSGYYYLIALFYWIFRMEPLAAVIPNLFVGIGAIVSLFYVLNKHFGKKVAFIGVFIQSVSMGMAIFDRWSVPTQPTMLWSIWFIEVILLAKKGNEKAIYLMALLMGLIWQIHIALAPVAILPLLAWGKRKVKLKNLFLATGLFLLVSSPLWLFEVKHNFSQIKSAIYGSQKEMGGPEGKMKLNKVINGASREIQSRLIWGDDQSKQVEIYFGLFILMSLVVIVKKRKIRNEVILLILWPLVMMAVQFWSKRIVSEYYFSNIMPSVITILALFLSDINKKGLVILAVTYGLINSFWLLTKSDMDHTYYYRRQAVKYIKNDVNKHDYPCVAVNFIADPGVGVGFRYLFWLENINLVKPGTDGVPVYNIAIPWSISADENPQRFGRFGVIVPQLPELITDSEVCQLPENQLDPLLGYVE